MKRVETILLWQPEGELVKRKHEAFVQKFLPEESILQLVEVDQKVFNFKAEDDVFLRFTDRSLLFKSKVRKISKDKIQILLPRKFRIIENRIKDRSSLIDQGLKIKIDLDERGARIKPSFEFEVLDLNSGGIGVVFSITKINNFIVGNEVHISKFGDVTLDKSIRCKVIHVTRCHPDVELITSREYKMGLKFIDEAPFFINSYEG